MGTLKCKPVSCPKCGRAVVEANAEGGNAGDMVIKSRLVFLNNDNNILAKCPGCKAVVALPLTIGPQEHENNGPTAVA